MSRESLSAVVIGAGVMGVTSAIELAARGWRVTLVDPGPLPRPEAASTDISKVIRMDYGADVVYTEMAEAALRGWDAWNAAGEPPLYHEDGFLLLARDAMQPGGFEYDSYMLLQRRGHPVERLTPAAIDRRFPAWSSDVYRDGYFNPRAGWAQSGDVMSRLIGRARAHGVHLRAGPSFDRVIEEQSRVTGVRLTDGSELKASLVLVAAGAWTPAILPSLGDVMWTTGQPVVHLQVERGDRWRAPRFPVWGADIGRSGWYGFPALPDGRLKIGHHGRGRRVHPDEPRTVLPRELDSVRHFLGESLPALAGAPIAATRLCLYCDTFDGDFWIDHDPDRPGLAVAAGDSGHGFKFAPILGPLIADILERRPNPWKSRFAWRSRGADRREAARASVSSQ